MYPDDWPKCPFCNKPAMDGHLTCGSAECNESEARQYVNFPLGKPKPNVSRRKPISGKFRENASEWQQNAPDVIPFPIRGRFGHSGVTKK